MKTNALTILLVFSILFNACAPTQVSNDVQPDFSGLEYFRGIFFRTGGFAKLIPQYASDIIFFDKLSEGKQREQYDFQTKLLETVNEEYPAFFNEFKKEMESGDHNRIENSINNAGKKLYFSMQKMPIFKEFFQKIALDNLKKEDILQPDGEIDKDKLEAKAAIYKDLLKETIASNSGEAGLCISWAAVFVVYVAAIIHGAVFFTSALAIAISAAVTLAITFTLPSDNPGAGAGSSRPINRPHQTSREGSTLEYEGLVNKIAELAPKY